MAKASKEILVVKEYINEYLAGKKPAKPMVADKGMQELLMSIDTLVSHGNRMADSSKQVLEAVSALSTFDVKLSHMSTGLMNVSGRLSDLYFWKKELFKKCSLS